MRVSHLKSLAIILCGFAIFGIALASYTSIVASAAGITINSSSMISSNFQEEPYIMQQVAYASNPGEVFQITGAQIAQRLVSSTYKNYLYLFVNPTVNFALNITGETASVAISGIATNNVYWNAQTYPNLSGNTMNYATVGQDLDTGATSNTLSEWQWVNLNYVIGAKVAQLNYSGSYDGGGPTACSTYANGQELHSVYVLIVDSKTKGIYLDTGANLIQQNISGIESTTFVTLVGTTHGTLNTSKDSMNCPVVANPSISPSLRWYIRTPPVAGAVSGATISGNFGITGTLGAGMNKAGTGALQLLQFVDRTFQTGLIPNQACATCVSNQYSTDPVSNATSLWPVTSGETTTSTQTTISANSTTS